MRVEIVTGGINAESKSGEYAGELGNSPFGKNSSNPKKGGKKKKRWRIPTQLNLEMYEFSAPI